MMKNFFLIITLIYFTILNVHSSDEVVSNYADIAEAKYKDAYILAGEMNDSINVLHNYSLPHFTVICQ